MDDPYEFQGFVRKVLDRVVKLETHIINLIHPIQSIAETLKSPNDIKQLLNLLAHPMKIDDRNLRILIADFRNAVEEFKKDLASLDLSQTFGEIKYIGKRLNQIEETLSEIKREGIAQKVHFDFKVDGYEMVKKPVNYHPEDPIENPDENIIRLLKNLSAQEQKVVIHRVGLFGEKKKPYTEIEKIIHVNRERCSMLYKKAIRKLRTKELREQVNKVTHKGLLKEMGT